MITIESVTKTYGAYTAVDDVSFAASPGRITGFLGPNGAGKSTTLRVVVGLTPPTAGAAHVLGRRFTDLPNPGREVGVLLDASAQHAGRTGREVLTLAALTMGLRLPRVEQLLHLVGLTDDEAGRRIRDYSLGMRQRLGIAHALLGDPSVLILDEPANGLDPAGIRWMRDLLRTQAEAGATVLLSSHLLHEIEVVADDLVVIGHGRIVAAGTKTDLLATTGTVVTTREPGRLTAALTLAGLTWTQTADPAAGVSDHRTAEEGAGRHVPALTTLRVDAEPEVVGRLARQTDVVLAGLCAADGDGLEDLFLELTAGSQRDPLARRPQGAVA
jgi:ABC-2 type transport system ATP-binding protein